MLRRFTLFSLLAVVLAVSPAPADEATTATVAHLKLSGSLDETPVAVDPILGVAGENFKSKLDRLRKAQHDKSISAIYLHLDGLQIGWGKLDELTRAIAAVRQSGKKVFAYLEAGETKDYLVALSCDEICLPDAGWLMLVGMRVEVSFYKDLLDKLGVKADFLQMGDFKSAAEPFTRNSLSPENRKQLESVLDDHFDHDLVARLIAGRKNKKWTPEQVKKLIDQGPFTAKAALEKGLIDRIAYPDGLNGIFKASLRVDQVKVVKDYGKAKSEELDFSNPFALLKMLAPPKPTSSRKPKIAVIYAVGAINTGKGGRSLMGGESVGSTTMVEAIRQAEEDKTVKAIVLRVDSPGGSALASDLIWNELRRCKKPVIASMGDVAASGGYYISMAANKIYADPGTLTGSIGVIGGKMALAGLYEKVGIKTETITRGANVGLLSVDTGFSKSERIAMTALMRDVYDQFLDKALLGRKKAGQKMTREQLVKLAGGRIWTGRQAKQNGLIDELGTLSDAIADAKKRAQMAPESEPELLILPKPRSALESLLELADADVRLAARLQGVPVLAEMQQHLRGAASLLQLRGERVWLVAPYGISVR